MQNESGIFGLKTREHLRYLPRRLRGKY